MIDYSSLTDEEIIALIKSGDENGVDHIFHRYKNLIEKCIKDKYLRSGGDMQDVRQEAMIGLYKAIVGFKPEKNVPFASFAVLCITSQIKAALSSYNAKKHTPLNNSSPLDTLSYDDFEKRDNPLVSRENVERYVIGPDFDSEGLRDILEQLSDLERNVLKLYCEGKRYKEIGAILGRSEKSVENAMYRIRSKKRSKK